MMNDMLSQEEINALLNGVGNSSEQEENINDDFDDIEKDALGEIGNISMGSAATTLFTLLNQKVEITTPSVKQTTVGEIAQNYPLPFVSVYIKYSMGIDGMNLLILKEEDVKVITSLMLGGDGLSDIPEELTDMHLSAISEAMNQMMGAASTSLSEMIGGKIDITPPIVSRVNFQGDRLDPEIIDPGKEIICTSFTMKVGNIIDSEIMQILPIDFAKRLVNKMMTGEFEEIAEEKNTVQKIEEKTVVEDIVEEIPVNTQKNEQKEMQYNYTQPPQYQQMPPIQVQNPVRVQPAQFSSFDANPVREFQVPENIDLIKDVMLQITVELGKTVKPIDEILDFKPGSILELDKVVGESLDILANGKKIAMGEVVVIDENYGIRITDIVKPDKRLQSL